MPVDNKAHPRAMVIVPTRELAKQVHEELSWLFAPKKTRIAAVTGGGGYRDELRAFRQQPAVVVGTPGRMLDHLNKGSIDATHVATFILDEADRMLDMGFREDIEAIFAFAPKERRTHLVSATFPREVLQLANRIQNNPAMVEGTPLGTANEDIEHQIHLVHQDERLNAIINLLLEDAGGQTLIFARTRANVAELSELLGEAGFSIVTLSGEMEQSERNRALATFKRGTADALVATDVAARGIDVTDVTRVIHAEAPTDADSYTHRSGRTGRAGKKGVSSILVSPRELHRTTALMQRAKVRFTFAPIPSAETLSDTRDQKMFDQLTADFVEGEAIDERSLALAERLLGSSEPARAVGRLVANMLARQAEPRDVTPIVAPDQRERRERAPTREGYTKFRVSWGTIYGADVRRLVAMICRRGNIEGRDIGAINLGKTSTVVEVASRVAEQFEQAASKPDPRDPRVMIRRWSDDPVGAPPPRDDAPPPPPRVKREDMPPPPKSKRAVAEDEDAGESGEVEVPVERSSKKLPTERPSKRDVSEAPPAAASSKKLPAERASKRVVEAAPSSGDLAPPAERSSKKLPAERASKRDVSEAPPAAASSKKLPAERASKRVVEAAPSSGDLFVDRGSGDDVAAPPPARSSKKLPAPDAAPSKPAPAKPKKKSAKAEEAPFEPKSAVVRRTPGASRAGGGDIAPFKPWKKPDDAGAPRADDRRGPPPRGDDRGHRGPPPPRTDDRRGPPPRTDDRRGPPPPRSDDRGYHGPPPGDDRGYRAPPPRGDDRGPRPQSNDRAAGPPSRGGPPPWERRGPARPGSGPPSHSGPPNRGGSAPPKRGRPS